MPFPSYANRCQAWIRLAMNEGLLDNYLEILLHDTSILSSHFHVGGAWQRTIACSSLTNMRSLVSQVGAFVRDPGLEKPEIVRDILRSLARFDFQLSIGDLCTRPTEAPDEPAVTSPTAAAAQAAALGKVAVSCCCYLVCLIPPPCFLFPFSSSSSCFPPPQKKKKKKKKKGSDWQDVAAVCVEELDAEPVAAPKTKAKKKKKRVHQRVRSIGNTGDLELAGSEAAPAAAAAAEPPATVASPNTDEDSEPDKPGSAAAAPSTPPAVPATPPPAAAEPLRSAATITPDSPATSTFFGNSPIVDPMSPQANRRELGTMDWMILEAEKQLAAHPRVLKPESRAKRPLTLTDPRSHAAAAAPPPAASGTRPAPVRPAPARTRQEADTPSPSPPKASESADPSTSNPSFGFLLSRYLDDAPRSPTLEVRI